VLPVKVLFIILTLSIGLLFAIAAAVLIRYWRHKQLISDTMLRGDFERTHSAEEQTLSETIGASR